MLDLYATPRGDTTVGLDSAFSGSNTINKESMTSRILSPLPYLRTAPKTGGTTLKFAKSPVAK